jgi:hypothetical protein
MQRIEGAQTPYEVYCFHCRVTFPAEARRCIHCGGRLSGRGEITAPPGLARVAPGPAPLPSPAVDPDADDAPQLLRRFGGLAVWALIALSAVISNLCRG